MDGLPLDVLQNVFVRVLQLQALDCLPRVCRQFRQALQEPSCVWESLEEKTLRHVCSKTDHPWRAGLPNDWLLRRGASVRTVCWTYASDLDAAQQAGVLAVCGQQAVQAVCGLLRSLPALEECRAAPNWGEPQDFVVEGDSTLPALCSALQQCRSLTCLVLGVVLGDEQHVEICRGVGQRASAALGQLTRLRSLDLSLGCSNDPSYGKEVRAFLPLPSRI